jgi:predicted HAD superfamily Cof-like phosphohydrolase
MKELIEKIQEWHNATGITTPSKPTDLIATRHLLRYDLMAEENDEYLQAWELVDIADALGDMLYILVGTIVEHGFADKIEDIFNEIHRSNMTKVVDGKVIRRDDGKILKPEGYEKPNLQKIIGGEQ